MKKVDSSVLLKENVYKATWYVMEDVTVSMVPMRPVVPPQHHLHAALVNSDAVTARVYLHICVVMPSSTVTTASMNTTAVIFLLNSLRVF